MTRFIFVAGGVMSGIGKGVATASIGKILSSRGFRVSAVKIDPYLNVDAGTMNPIEHGEVFVTDDGVECDQDMGNYERFLDINLPRDNYMTTGSVYQTVITRERNLEYGGRCVEIVPHIPEEVIARLDRAAKKAKADFLLVEVGGTVGEYQNLIFLEAGRMMNLERPGQVMFVLVSYLPVPSFIGEMKTKPTQQAVRTLNGIGIQPDMILARSSHPLDEPRKRKISIFCNVSPQDVISAPDVSSIYDVPLNFEKEGLGDRVLVKFGLKRRRNGRDMKEWKRLVLRAKRVKTPVKIGIVGKYFGTGNFTLSDSYLSVIEAIKHASWAEGRKPEIKWLDAESYEKSAKNLEELKKFDGIIVPGGFGSRGIEGKIKVIEYCRKKKIPFLGLCYGLQLAVIEFARNVCKLRSANTTEIDAKTKHPVIHTLPEQLMYIQEKKMGGSMRLGAYTCELKPGTKAARAYGEHMVSERHRHRYEVNNEYREILEKKGLVVSGLNPERNLIEIMELKNHPFFLGTQAHPELKSRPLHPHPLFRAFVRAAKNRK
ncbi:MAG: CTP synthase [Candidatus Sungbacteria bacterium]|nr:CTP synthase [Candidatus Sungbacteria bacterium]